LTKETVAVIGSGTMGTALAHVVARRMPCVLWTPSPEVATAINERRRHPVHFAGQLLATSLRATTKLADASDAAELVIIAVGSGQLRTVATEVARVSRPGQAFVSATKGLEANTHLRMSQVLAEVMGTDRVGAISGPNVTTEIMADKPTPIVVASHSRDVVELSLRALSAPPLYVHDSDDLVGVELAGALKNVVAIATGVGFGLGIGDNACSLLFARGLAEIQRLGAALGARPATFLGLAGLSDLFMTATCSTVSMNREFGVKLGAGHSASDILATLTERPEGPIRSSRVSSSPSAPACVCRWPGRSTRS
jgi:glycerol-3-phosphate dehydrogenase (NAD(P)+)